MTRPDTNMIEEQRMKFENGSASPVVLHLTPLPQSGGIFATRVEKTAKGETVHSYFRPLEEALLVRGWNSLEDIVWGMQKCGYRRVG